MMLGTGGDMEKGTLDAAAMMYAPEAYDILPFPDIWEHKGNIGLFIPATLALNNYKDKTGFTNEEAARKALLDKRQKIKVSAAGSQALNKEIQYRPLIPSEMFLTKTANIFPSLELRRRLAELETGGMLSNLETYVDLYFDPDSKYNGVNYSVKLDGVPINKFPWTEDAIEGCVIMYEAPYMIEGSVPEGAYIIGYDPIRDNVSTGESFAAIYVIKTTKFPTTVGHNEIVAAYIGRPYLGVNVVNDILHKLSLFYGNAKIYFENAVGNTKDYFEKIRRLDLLAKQPVNVLNKKASFDSRESIIYGYPMSNEKIKMEALQYVRSWLLEERSTGVRNLDLIPDRLLIQQLISFNLDGNFDAVMGFVGCIIGLEEIYVSTKRKEEYGLQLTELDKEFSKIFINNKLIFPYNEKFSSATSAL